MSDRERLVVEDSDEDKPACIHQWFWQDFTLHPAGTVRNVDDHHKGLKPAFWAEFFHAVHEMGKTAGTSAGTLHQWFWQDFVLIPRERGAQRHDCQRGAKQWCWEDCVTTIPEKVATGGDKR